MNALEEAVALQTNPPEPASTGQKMETVPAPKSELARRYQKVRRFSEGLCKTLEPEDYVIQTMPEASPTKWHMAHTSWFFETFLLKQFFPGYQAMRPEYG